MNRIFPGNGFGEMPRVALWGPLQLGKGILTSTMNMKEEDMKGQMIYESTYMRYLEWSILRTKNAKEVVGAGRGVCWETVKWGNEVR